MAFEWKTNVKDVNKVSDEKLDLLLSQAEKRLKATVSSHDQLHLRAGVLLSFVVAFTTWIFGARGDLMSLIYIPFAISSCVFSLMVIIPRKIDVEGYCPDLLYNKKQMGKSDKEFKEVFIRQYGIKIVENIGITDRMGLYLNAGIISFVSGILLYSAATSLLSVWRFVATVCN